MRRLLLCVKICLALFWVPTAAVADEQVRLTYLFSDSNAAATLTAYRTLMLERPDLAQRVRLNMISEATLEGLDIQQVLASNVLVFDTMNEQILATLDRQHGVDLVSSISRNGTVLAVGESLSPQEVFISKGAIFDPRAMTYWMHAGASNHLGLMKLALIAAGVEGLELPPAQTSLEMGYYYPTEDGGRVFADWAQFKTWVEARHPVGEAAPRIAVSFYKASVYGGDMSVMDAVIRQIEAQGARAVPIFGYPAPVAFEQLLVEPDGSVRVDAAIGANFQFGDAQAALRLQGIDIPVLNAITLYGRSEAEWRASKTGLSTFEGTFNVAVPELAGTIAPTVIGSVERRQDSVTGAWVSANEPIAERVQTIVARAIRYASLRNILNKNKRIAVLFYNYPSGKANVSASYLNVAESLHNVLRAMADQGYDVGPAVPDADSLLSEIVERARNVMGAAPGELSAMLANGDAQRVSVGQYRQWLNALEPSLRAKILADWGEPEQARLMVTPEGDFAIPVLRFGNIVLLPQPARGWGEDLTALYHAQNLAPHHQYVAAYSWLRHGFDADAVVHVGTHGTLEWLDGRDTGLAPDDASDALIGDLPHAYIYNVDVVGEGLIARRRSAAVLVDHMVPPFVSNTLTLDLAKLGEKLNEHTLNEGKNPELAVLYAREARDMAIALGLAKDLSLDPQADWSDAQLHQLEGYILQLKSELIPYGLHAFGRTPTAEATESTVEAIVNVDREQSLDQRAVSAAEMRQRIMSSGPRELDSLMRLLSGRFVPAGMGGEPIRNPDAYATGKNFYGIDPDKVPKPVAWNIGVRLADEMLASHLAEHGRYPQKVSFVIWGDETMRHEGIVESQIFHLLGTRPVWDARGKVVDVELISREELGRPRVDIVIASAAEGMFSNVTQLMDRAVQLAKAEQEADNAVRANYLTIRQALMANGVNEADADKMAGVRIFDEPPGQFNLNTSAIAGNSGSWDSDAGMVNDYIRKMGHAYGNGYWGEAMPEVFGMAIANTDAIVHSSSTSLYGALDNDDMYMYMGGLSAAVKSVSDPDHSAQLLITNTRNPDQIAMTGIDAFIGAEFRSRYVNPAWIEGMKTEGYAGAGAIREFVEYLWGWDATASQTVDDAMWNEVYSTYIEDKHNLDIQAFFEGASPYALQDMTARMIETVRKGYWNADQKTRDRLVRDYLDSVNRHGVNCTEVSCGNARMLEYALEQAQAQGLDAALIDQARQSFEQAMGETVAEAANALRAFVARNENDERLIQAQIRGQLDLAKAIMEGPSQIESQAVDRPVQAEAPNLSIDAAKVPLTGFVMTQEVIKTAEAQLSSPRSDLKIELWQAIAALFSLFAVARLSRARMQAA